MRVLVVEDEINIARSLHKALTHEGFVVDVAHEGVTGQWFATENPYDVIVLDIMLPGRNGYDVLRNLRALQIWTSRGGRSGRRRSAGGLDRRAGGAGWTRVPPRVRISG